MAFCCLVGGLHFASLFGVGLHFVLVFGVFWWVFCFLFFFFPKIDSVSWN